jgi:hypothetical protein
VFGKQKTETIQKTKLKAMKRSHVKKTENKQIKKTISLLSIKLGHTDVMVGCWVSQLGASNPYLRERIFSTDF